MRQQIVRTRYGLLLGPKFEKFPVIPCLTGNSPVPRTARDEARKFTRLLRQQGRQVDGELGWGGNSRPVTGG